MLFVIRKGAVALDDENGQPLEQRGEGELFGHAIEFTPAQPQYRVRAIEDSSSLATFGFMRRR